MSSRGHTSAHNTPSPRCYKEGVVYLGGRGCCRCGVAKRKNEPPASLFTTSPFPGPPIGRPAGNQGTWKGPCLQVTLPSQGPQRRGRLGVRGQGEPAARPSPKEPPSGDFWVRTASAAPSVGWCSLSSATETNSRAETDSRRCQVTAASVPWERSRVWGRRERSWLAALSATALAVSVPSGARAAVPAHRHHGGVRLRAGGQADRHQQALLQ